MFEFLSSSSQEKTGTKKVKDSKSNATTEPVEEIKQEPMKMQNIERDWNFSGRYRKYNTKTNATILEGDYRNGQKYGIWVDYESSRDVAIYEYEMGGRRGAVCRDGSTSFSTGQGTCSHHGGVKTWVLQTKQKFITGSGKFKKTSDTPLQNILKTQSKPQSQESKKKIDDLAKMIKLAKQQSEDKDQQLNKLTDAINLVKKQSSQKDQELIKLTKSINEIKQKLRLKDQELKKIASDLQLSHNENERLVDQLKNSEYQKKLEQEEKKRKEYYAAVRNWEKRELKNQRFLRKAGTFQSNQPDSRKQSYFTDQTQNQQRTNILNPEEMKKKVTIKHDMLKSIFIQAMRKATEQN